MGEIKYFSLAKRKSTFKGVVRDKSGKEVGLYFYFVVEFQCVISFLIWVVTGKPFSILNC